MVKETEALLKQFESLSKDVLATAEEYGKQYKGVIAVSGMYMPEELIHAAGFLPVVLLEQEEPVSAANAHVQPFMCGYVRSLMDQVLEGKLSFLKALFIKDCCHELRMIGDLARCTQNDKVNIEFFFFPVTIKSPASVKFTLEEIKRVRAKAEAYSGEPLTDEKIRNSIKVYNEFRKAMTDLYAVRMEFPGIISALELRNVVRASMSMPKEIVTGMVKELTEQLRSAAASGEYKKSKASKILLSGSLCESAEVSLINAIETSDAVIVDDELYVGRRYFNTPVDENAEDLDAAFANAYTFRNGPCATQTDPEKRNGDYLAERAKEAGADGVITVVIKFCEAHYFGNLADMNDLKDKHGVKVFSVFTDHDTDTQGQLQTRIQSFIENL